MHEMAKILMKSASGWTELQTSDATLLFQFGDATMIIAPDGSWHCEAPGTRVTKSIGRGKVGALKKFLEDFAAANPL